jgi:hypothetical protein|tara:strand:+ start:340 stop:858 length:519 start_codon:yes stop_codon:yes gene_type:complete
MKLGRVKIKIFLIIASLLFNFKAISEEKISTTPLINLENLKPSYEEPEKDEIDQKQNIIILKEKKLKNESNKKLNLVNIIGLDKITAKTSPISIKLGETKKFGLLEIKAIKCGNSKSSNQPGYVAYIQVKDLSDKQSEKVFVFNGWTFSNSPSLTPIDHPVYDLWLVSCYNT